MTTTTAPEKNVARLSPVKYQRHTTLQMTEQNKAKCQQEIRLNLMCLNSALCVCVSVNGICRTSLKATFHQLPILLPLRLPSIPSRLLISSGLPFFFLLFVFSNRYQLLLMLSHFTVSTRLMTSTTVSLQFILFCFSASKSKRTW